MRSNLQNCADWSAVPGLRPAEVWSAVPDEWSAVPAKAWSAVLELHVTLPLSSKRLVDEELEPSGEKVLTRLHKKRTETTE